RRFRPQIVHAHLHEGILIGAVIRRLTGAPLVADLQGSLEAELVDHDFLVAGGRLARGVARLERWLVRHPDAILTSSVAGRPLLERQGVPANRIVSLPDGAALEHFRPLPAEDALVDRLGLRGKQVVVFLGVLTPYQGVDALIDAIPAVVRARPDTHFLIMGYPNEDRYRTLVASRGLEPWATLSGRVAYGDAPRWLALGAVAVSPKTSLTEANGKLLNYMASGLAVVATDTAVNRELLGESGVYAPVGDAQALAARLVELLGDRERRREIGAALRARAEAHFDWLALTERLLDVYGCAARARAVSP
ncbi:MAG: glycosyltransferase family 4 protein, partial [Gemmatimonadetes bacterium]|nr:glycosyltransferase family 4 protein [Gemmatimonadota bacterium]